MKKETKKTTAQREYDVAFILSPLDSRDYQYEHLYCVTPMPIWVDHTPDMPNLVTQLPGQCTAFALCAIKRFQEYKSMGMTDAFSTDFLWRRRRIINKKQKGMFVRDGLNILRGEGVSTIFSEVTLPRNKVIKEALNFRIRAYAKIMTTYGLRQALLRNGLCVCVLPVYNFSKTFWKKEESEELWGCHTVSIVGYDDEKREFKIGNPWGESWGDNGYGYVSYNDFGLIYECWTVLDDKSARLAGIKYKDNGLWLKVKIWAWRYYVKRFKK